MFNVISSLCIHKKYFILESSEIDIENLMFIPNDALEESLSLMSNE